MKNVLVTGGNGQLGTALWDVLGLEQTHNENNYTFTDVDTFAKAMPAFLSFFAAIIATSLLISNSPLSTSVPSS